MHHVDAPPGVTGQGGCVYCAVVPRVVCVHRAIQVGICIPRRHDPTSGAPHAQSVGRSAARWVSRGGTGFRDGMPRLRAQPYGSTEKPECGGVAFLVCGTGHSLHGTGCPTPLSVAPTLSVIGGTCSGWSRVVCAVVCLQRAACALGHAWCVLHHVCS
eukprot:3663543-Prymnesium_polylepis.1